MSGSKLNGSVDLLAKAMRQVFTEAVQEGVQPIKESVDGLKQDVDGLKQDVGGLKQDVGGLKQDVGGLKQGLETTNNNVQAQLAQNRKDISKDVKGALDRSK